MKFPLIHLMLLYFILLSEKMYLTAERFNMPIISMGLKWIYVEAFRTQTKSMVKLLCQNHKKAL